jgi:tetratricopeptide (TPR) repeat protein
MNNQGKLDTQEKIASKNINVIPSGESILEKIGIDLTQIKLIKPRSKRSQYRAIINWLTKNFVNNHSDLEILHPYFQTLYHLCQLKEWKSIQIILNIDISINPEYFYLSLPLYEYLLFKKLPSQLLNISQEIIKSMVQTEVDITPLLMLKARALSGISDKVEDGWNLFEEICRQQPINSDLHIEAKTCLGISMIELGFYKEGLQHIDTVLTLIDSHNKLNSNPKIQELKADILSTKGYYEMNSSHFAQAIELYKQAATILKKLGLEHKLISPLAHQGIIMRKKGKYEQAFNYLIEAKQKARNINNEIDIAWVNHHLGYVVLNQGKTEFAQKLSESSLEAFRKIERKRGISDCYEQLGLINLAQKKFDEAENNFKRSLNIRKSINNRHGEASSLLDLALSSWHKKRYFKSLAFLWQGFKLYVKIGVLNRIRFFRMLKLAYVWILGRRDSTM